VEAVLCLHQVGNFALVQAEGGFLEFGDGLALRNPTQVAAFVLGAGIFGVFLGDILELGPFFGLLEDVFAFWRISSTSASVLPTVINRTCST